jgi:carbonic anhydrase
MAGSKKELPFNVSADDILPVNQDYYRFNGSLTTPPCSEGVLWLVMKQPITVSKEQIQQFRDMMQQPTNRPIQPINARPVLE